MKNTFNFNLGEINVTIEGTPVQISNFQMEYTNEASVQELAAGASFIKDIVSQIKDLINQATTPTPTPTVIKRVEAPIEESPTPVSRDLMCLWKSISNAAPKESETSLSTLSLKKDGVRIEANLEEDVIRIHIWSRGDVIHGHVYSDHESWSGAPTALYSGILDCIFTDAGEDTASFAKRLMNLNPAWVGIGK